VRSRNGLSIGAKSRTVAGKVCRGIKLIGLLFGVAGALLI
jgi:hypothetical protein